MQTDDTRERATGSTVPFQPLLGTVAGGNPLHLQGRPGAPSGKTPNPFWDSCLQTVTSDRRAPSGFHGHAHGRSPDRGD